MIFNILKCIFKVFSMRYLTFNPIFRNISKKELLENRFHVFILIFSVNKFFFVVCFKIQCHLNCTLKLSLHSLVMNFHVPIMIMEKMNKLLQNVVLYLNIFFKKNQLKTHKNLKATYCIIHLFNTV